MSILAGDVGGTKTILALFDERDGDLVEIDAEAYASARHASLSEILASFLRGRGEPPRRACLGVPGPVVGGRARITNLPWEVDASALARDAGLARVILVNDVEAMAHGIPALRPGEVVDLLSGEPGAAGNAALMAVGTGLGQAGLHWDGARHRPFATEGGHATFAPRGDLEAELLRRLATRHGHVSWERVASGPGLASIHEFLREMRRVPVPPSLASRLAAEDPAAVVTREALEGTDAVCGEAVDLFLGFLGAQAGNLALSLMATGGVYLGGGIPPRLKARLLGPRFAEAFLAKGRMRHLMERIPVRLILEPRLALRGAARCARGAPEGSTAGL